MKFGVLVYLLSNDFWYINIYSGYKVFMIPTTKYIITGTDYHFFYQAEELMCILQDT